MIDANRPASYVDPVNRAATARRPPVTEAGRRTPVTTGPMFDSLDVAAYVAYAIMNLGPLAMAAFWAPYH